MTLETAIARIRSLTPGGVPLAPLAWAPRHRWIVRLLWLHVLPITAMSLAQGLGLAHTILDLSPIVTLAYFADRTRFDQRTRSIAASLGLMASSAVLVHLSGGLTEMHFHFFVMLGVISLYQDWRPYLMSIGFVALHHGVIGALTAENVFDHEEAWRAPVKWAAIHAFFVLASAATSIMSWQIVEDSNRDANAERDEIQRRFRAVVENSADVVTIIDPTGVVLYDSPSCEQILGYRDRTGADCLALVHPDDAERVVAALAELVMNDRSTINDLEMRVRHADGHYLWVSATAKNLLEEEGVAGIDCNYREITQRKALEEELSHQAFHDSLTGLANRALLFDRVEHALHRGRSRHDARVGLLFLDLDDFKTVNDALGHRAGDLILQVVANRLNQVVRPADTAARLGGDEFAILVEDLPSDPAMVYEIGARLLEQVCTPLQIDETLIAVNASLGIVVSDGTEDAESLLRNADLAMYRAKNSGKGRFEIYEAGMHAAVVERMAIKADLRRAVEANEFRPLYQPIVDLVSGRVTGAEALARWYHPSRGVLAPAAFIPLAEETGIIADIGWAILDQACSDASRWLRTYGEGAPTSVSVNLAHQQLKDGGLVERVERTLAANGLSPARLTLEVTETVLLDDADHIASQLAELKQLGVRIALDDFGTGYSSLSHLERFPVDIVKIDKSFIDSLAVSYERPSPLVGAIVNLGAVLGLGVTAEGIEDKEQLAQLKNMGCGHGQGYYFARPLPEPELAALFAQHHQQPSH
jgi:diguanylate cyclase (GGDEF)-like protein/PAS domain S-box-containing protein